MEFTSAQLGSGWLAAGAAGAVAVLVRAVWRAPWRRLLDSEMQHACGAACVALMLLWSIRTGLVPAPGYHFFGVTTLTLMFGWELACLAAVPVLVAGCLAGHGDWGALGVNALVLFMLPAALSWALLRVAQRRLPHHFFIFIYVNAYFGAAAAMVLTTLVMAGLLMAAGVTTPGGMAGDHLLFLPLLALAEGFINGMTMTVLVATRPGWVWTFDDASYLSG